MTRRSHRNRRNHFRMQPIFAVLGATILALGSLSCGGGKSNSVKIAFAAGALAPPSSLALSGISTFAAQVSGDTNALGVDWSVSCVPAPIPQGTCGTITAHTAN